MELKEFDFQKHSLAINSAIDKDLSKEVIQFYDSIYREDSAVNLWNETAIKSIYPNIKFTNEFPKITIYLNSPGGEVKQSLAIYDTIKRNNLIYDQLILCTGGVSSGGTIVLLSVPLEKRICTENTTFMIHQASSFTLGKLKEMEEDIDESKRLNDLTFNLYTENTKITKEKLNEIYEKKIDWWITAKEAVELGLVSNII